MSEQVEGIPIQITGSVQPGRHRDEADVASRIANGFPTILTDMHIRLGDMMIRSPEGGEDATMVVALQTGTLEAAPAPAAVPDVKAAEPNRRLSRVVSSEVSRGGENDPTSPLTLGRFLDFAEVNGDSEVLARRSWNFLIRKYQRSGSRNRPFEVTFDSDPKHKERPYTYATIDPQSFRAYIDEATNQLEVFKATHGVVGSFWRVFEVDFAPTVYIFWKKFVDEKMTPPPTSLDSKVA